MWKRHFTVFGHVFQILSFKLQLWSVGTIAKQLAGETPDLINWQDNVYEVQFEATCQQFLCIWLWILLVLSLSLFALKSQLNIFLSKMPLNTHKHSMFRIKHLTISHLLALWWLQQCGTPAVTLLERKTANWSPSKLGLFSSGRRVDS